MKKTSLIIMFAVCMSSFMTSCNETSKSINTTPVDSLYYTPNPSGFRISKGINLSHWLSQVFGWSPRSKFVTESDIRLLDSIGFDHVRLPIDEENLWAEDGTIIDSSLSDVKNCIDWCLKYNLRVVVDLHILRSHHFNARNGEGAMKLWTDTIAQDNFIHMWENLSDQLRNYPDSMVAYEPMNEPVAPDHEMWNKLLNRAMKAIRAKEPNRVVIFGSNMWQKPYTYPYLEIPRGDKNIILSFHSYHPYFLTHYKAYWSVAKSYSGAVRYPGQTISNDDFEKYIDPKDSALNLRIVEEMALDTFNIIKLQEIFQPAIDKAREYGLQLYCNEFGCLPSAPREDRLRYYSDVTDIFRREYIAFSSWDYKGDFGLVGWDRNEFVTKSIDVEIAHILVK